MRRFGTVFRYYFNLHIDRAEEPAVIESITRNIAFRGANLWTLIFAIIIASVGLNVNAPAAIIGAMLISPLMGPIMGIGLGIGILDFELVRRGVKNLFIAVVFSIATSTLYFYLTPLHNATSELLARTTPTIWDVFIAFAGGLAGIIGATRKEKGNVIPGVAIATALMPPLCTAGYGLATGHWYYTLGAVYLFFINSVFICTATVLILRFMKFHRHLIEDRLRRRRVMRLIVVIVIITAGPSILLAYRMVNKAIFENAADSYVRKELNLRNTQVVSKTYFFDPERSKIELLLIGEVLDSVKIDSLKRRLPLYNLKNTQLIVRQGLDASHEIDFVQVKASILDEVLRNQDTIIEAAASVAVDTVLPDISGELRALFPQVKAYTLQRVAIIPTDSQAVSRNALMFVAAAKASSIKTADKLRMQRWLEVKFASDSVQVFVRGLE